MTELTMAELESLDHKSFMFYLSNKDKLDFSVMNGKLFFRQGAVPYVSWERYMQLYRDCAYEDCARVDPEGPYVIVQTDHMNWNSGGRPYLDRGFYFWLWLDVRGNGYTKKEKEAEKDILRDYLLAHGASGNELDSIRWNGHGYTAEFRCRFTDVPRAHLPKKVLKWVQKNPLYAHRIFQK